LLAGALRRKGYNVLVAADGAQAWHTAEAYAGDIDLLLTDVVMRGISGPELVMRLRKSLPTLKVVYMSGYTDEAIVHHGVLDSGVEFIQKPFRPASLARKVREVLESEPPAVAGG